MKSSWLISAVSAGLATSAAAGGAIDPITLVESHLSHLATHGTDTYGQQQSAMWVSSLDLNTRALPASVYPQAGVRVYRNIVAPRGSTLYWDTPQLAAAHRLSSMTGNPAHAAAADAYIGAFLQVGVGDHGLFGWGSHYFWDVQTDRLMFFIDNETPVNATSSRTYHEMRPHTPDWQLFWRIDPIATERHIRAVGEHHVKGGFATTTGAFDRHAYGPGSIVPEYSFVEAGGVIVESLTWLHQKTAPASTELTDLAKQVARYSYDARSLSTGLVPNQRDTNRWDRHVTTSEIGVWGASVLKAYDHTGDTEYRDMAAGAVKAYLQHAWDPQTDRYFGKVNISNGSPNFGTTTTFQPGRYSRAWNALFPTHDYLIALGDASISLHAATNDPAFEVAARRIARVMHEERAGLNAIDGNGAYAELYGRGIRFLLNAAEEFDDPALHQQARRLAHEAIYVLHHNGMFRGHGGEDRYDAVDGVGFLLDALLDVGPIPTRNDARTLARYSFSNAQGFTAAPSETDAFVIAAPMTAGTGLNALVSVGGNPAPSVGISGLNATAATQQHAVDAAAYLSFVISADDGMRLDLSHLLFDLQRSAGSHAPTRYALRSSVDGFAANLAADELWDATFRTYFVSLLDDAFADLQQIELRFYFYGGSGQQDLYARLDNLQIIGDARAIPEPAAVAMLLLGGAASVWRRTKQTNRGRS